MSATKTSSTKTKRASILSITSATKGWNAVFFDSDAPDIWFESVACFALCKRGTETFVGSVVSQDNKGLVIAEEAGNFLGIAAPGESSEDWEEAVAAMAAENEDNDDDDDDDVQVIDVGNIPRRKKRITIKG